MLASPSQCYRDSFLEGAAEFAREGRLDSTYSVALGYTVASLQQRFADFVRDLRALADPDRVRPGWYVDQVLWLIHQGEYTGQASVRPELCTDYLRTYGGHVGYSIRPARRRCGHGTRLLRLVLQTCRQLGLARILVTCDSDNIGSRRVIERNGGAFESALPMTARAFRAEGRRPVAGVTKLRYWIDLSLPASDPLPTP
ncbi:MAG: GNAT family N-acetyltransferase [Candidatus Latescibacterota bacterium]